MDKVLRNVPEKNIKLISSTEQGTVFLFNVNYYVITYFLYRGQYILKIDARGLSESGINRFITLSNNSLIPKIYYIDPIFIIQKFIPSVDLRKLFRETGTEPHSSSVLKKYLYQEIKKELNHWHKLGFGGHGDFDTRNILLDTKGKIWLIDPAPNQLSNTIKNDVLTLSDIEYFDILGKTV